MNAQQYDYNVEIDVGGVTYTGPGMDTEREATIIKEAVSVKDCVQDARVIQQ